MSTIGNAALGGPPEGQKHSLLMSLNKVGDIILEFPSKLYFQNE